MPFIRERRIIDLTDHALIRFAWTNYPSIHWMVSIAACVPFGAGVVLVFLGIMNYLIDGYVFMSRIVLVSKTVAKLLRF